MYWTSLEKKRISKEKEKFFDFSYLSSKFIRLRPLVALHRCFEDITGAPNLFQTRAARETEAVVATHAPPPPSSSSSSLSPIRGMHNCSRRISGCLRDDSLLASEPRYRGDRFPRDSPLLRSRSEMWNIFKGTDNEEKNYATCLIRREIGLSEW